jgi:hypothetical protein
MVGGKLMGCSEDVCDGLARVCWIGEEDVRGFIQEQAVV